MKTVYEVHSWLQRRAFDLAYKLPRSERAAFRDEAEILRVAAEQIQKLDRREQEILRLADALRAVQRTLKGPHRTPGDVHRAVCKARRQLANTGKPVEGKCRRCGYVAMQRREPCPRCDLTAKDGVERGTHSKRWR